MKIAILGTRGIPNNYGGFEQCAESLSIGLVKRGHEVFGEDKIQMLSHHNEGDQVEVSFNLSSNEYNGKYYSNIDAWRIESLGGGAQNTTEPDIPSFDDSENSDDDLPF